MIDQRTPMLCLVHGYGLTGSGSNQWTRSILHGLCDVGEQVHVVCQENRPEQFDFVAAAFSYAPDGGPTELFRRDVPYSGRCVLHRPQLEILPTYVRPQATNTYMASILDLSTEAIDDYLRRNEAAMERVLGDNEISAVHVNHVVLMAVAVHRTCTRRGIPFGVMPHGSAIEYVVKHDERMHRLASDALEDADLIFTLSPEMQERIQLVFPEVTNASEKMVSASAGVDTKQFRVIEREERPAAVTTLKRALSEVPRGKKAAQRKALRDRLHDNMPLQEFLQTLRDEEAYPPKLPDEGIEEALDAVDWAHDDVITFVGKIIGYKGLPALVAAFPSIAERRPRARLVIAGRGNLRAGLEALVYALSDGHRTLATNIIRWGGAIEGEEEAPFDRVTAYFGRMAGEGRLDAYFDAARRHVSPERIIFTGYMEHDLLSHIFPCCDVAIFPSIVKEAAPLVVPEAMASGCFPVGTDFAGMKASLDVASEAVPPSIGKLMRLRPDPEHTVIDIVENVSALLEVADDHREALRRLAVDRYDWRSVARRLASDMYAMRARARA